MTGLFVRGKQMDLSQSILRTNVRIRLVPCCNADKRELLLSRLPEKAEGAELFRVRSEEAGVGLLRLLKERGRDARMASHRQTESELLRTEAWFEKAGAPSLVAVEPLPISCVRNDVRALYAMNLPPSLGAAAEDLSRVARDGLTADAVFFASGHDFRVRQAAVEAVPDPEERKTALDRLARSVAWLENDGCARVFLAAEAPGRAVGPCGNCGWCLGRRAAYLPAEE